MDLNDLEFITRTTGCPNGCARPYMAELAFVGSGPGTYQLWLGGSPNQDGRTGYATDIFKMKYEELEETVEPIFAMYKEQRSSPTEAFGDFTHRVGWEPIKKYMETYVSPFGAAATAEAAPAAAAAAAGAAAAPLDGSLLARLTAVAEARGMTTNRLLEAMVTVSLESIEALEALEGK